MEGWGWEAAGDLGLISTGPQVEKGHLALLPGILGGLRVRCCLWEGRNVCRQQSTNTKCEATFPRPESPHLPKRRKSLLSG